MRAAYERGEGTPCPRHQDRERPRSRSIAPTPLTILFDWPYGAPIVLDQLREDGGRRNSADQDREQHGQAESDQRGDAQSRPERQVEQRSQPE